MGPGIHVCGDSPTRTFSVYCSYYAILYFEYIYDLRDLVIIIVIIHFCLTLG